MEIGRYTSNLGPLTRYLSHWLTHWSVRIILLYPIWSLFPGSGFLFNPKKQYGTKTKNSDLWYHHLQFTEPGPY